MAKGRIIKRTAWLVLALVVAVFFFAAGYQLAAFFQKIYSTDLDMEEGQPPPKKPNSSRVNILLLGIDARGGDAHSRTDTIIVLSVDLKTREAAMLSIPRDSRVEIPGYGVDKINHAHAFGGVALTIETVEKLLGVPINYFARINFQGFQAMVDALGGVTLEVEPEVAQYIPGLDAGWQRLNGEQALDYVRQRNIPGTNGDFGRIQRQQKFLLAVGRNVGSVNNITRIPSFLSALGDNLRTNIPMAEMTRLANALLRVDLEEVRQGYLPGQSRMINGIYYWILDHEAKEAMLQEMGLMV